MADYIDITKVVIDSVSVAPNPVKASQTLTVIANVREELIQRIYPLPFHSGELTSGEA